ncbi:MAG: GNAT family N-acetyltransferase [Melioribacteraceae bacterium]|nr:GNAT family N-acetyltransferase [Melioribacteraceae bacterium]
MNVKLSGLEKEIFSEVNLNALAKSIYDESIVMKFSSGDYVKLMNEIIDMTIEKPESASIEISDDNDQDEITSDLPIESKNLIIRYYNSEIDKKYVSKWFETDNNNLFLLSTNTRNHLDVESIKNDENNIFATITLKDKKPIGLLAILNIDKRNKKGEMRKMIGNIKERGKGYGKESTQLWLKYCTGFLDLRKVYINTIETNIKNISLNRQLGLKIEGLLKQDCILDNVVHDVLRMAYIRKVKNS